MADTRISGLSALAGNNVDDTDELVIVDKADTSMAASGTTKKITFAEFNKALQRRDLGVDLWTVIGGLFL